jgi:hypothetical protein
MPDILEDARPRPALSSTSDAPVVEEAPAPAPAAEPTAEVQPVVVDPKLGAALADAEVELPDQTPHEDGEAAPEAEPAAEPAVPRTPRPKFGERLSELTRQRDQALAELEKANQRITEEARRRTEPPPPPPAPETVETAAPEPPPRPRRENFTDPDAYEDARDAWVRETTKAELRAEQQRAAQDWQRQNQQNRDANNQREIIQRVQDGWQKVVERGSAKHDDFVDQVNKVDLPMTVPMISAITQADNGDDVAYYLATNPEETRRIASMVREGEFLPELPLMADGSRNPLSGTPLPDFPRQTFAMGQISARLAATPAVPVTRAPPPITPVRNNAAATPRDIYDVGNEPGNTEYYALREKQLADERAAARGRRH